jgi:predicted Zn-dependent protease
MKYINIYGANLVGFATAAKIVKSPILIKAANVMKVMKVMKGVNVTNLTKTALFTLLLSSLSACNTGTTKPDSDTANTAAQMLSTAEYIPVITQDKHGVTLPYEVQQDPYSALKGRIDKNHILAFIDAQRAFKAKRYDQAISKLEALIKQQPKLSGPWVILGNIAVEKGNLQSAQEHYTKAIETNPANINAYLRLALNLRKQGEYLKAQNVYTAALQQWPDFPEAHLNLAVLYDIYLNHPIRAQRHIEAYQFLSHGENPETAQWLDEIRSRTGLSVKLSLQNPILAQEI